MIHIWTTTSWILNKCSVRLKNSLTEIGYESDIISEPADINIYLDIQNCYFKKTEGRDIGIFTHLHEDNLLYFKNEWTSLDNIVCMGKRYYRDLKLVYPESKLSYCVMAEPPPWQLKKTKIGIFQRGEHVGKGFHFLFNLPNDHLELLKEFKFVFVGSGWCEVIDKYKKLGISCSYHEHENYEAYDELYDSIDYLLVPSLWEGGPMSIVEASQKGIPIISSDVGFAIEDFPIDHIFRKNDEKALTNIFESIRIPVRARRNNLAGISMKDFAQHIISLLY